MVSIVFSLSLIQIHNRPCKWYNITFLPCFGIICRFILRRIANHIVLNPHSFVSIVQNNIQRWYHQKNTFRSRLPQLKYLIAELIFSKPSYAALHGWRVWRQPASGGAGVWEKVPRRERQCGGPVERERVITLSVGEWTWLNGGRALTVGKGDWLDNSTRIRRK